MNLVKCYPNPRVFMQFADCGPLSSLKKVINPVVFGVGGVYNPFFSVFAFCPAVMSYVLDLSY
jgi:hypothetical protein